MSPQMPPAESPSRASRTLDPSVLLPAPTVVSVRALQQELAELRLEVESLRVQRQRDLATTRGLGEALQSLRRGALALRAENEELRRDAASRAGRRRAGVRDQPRSSRNVSQAGSRSA